MAYRVSVNGGSGRIENINSCLQDTEPSIIDKIQNSESILIKVQLLHHLNQAASTHIDAVRAVIDFLKRHTNAHIYIGDGAYHGTNAAFRNFGYESLSDLYDDISLIDLNKDETISGRYIKRDASNGVMQFSKLSFEADFTISLSPLCTHQYTGVSLSMKNWVIGTWVCEPAFGPFGKYWPRWKVLDEEGLWAYHMSISELIGQSKPSLSVIDGYIGVQGDNPGSGEAISVDVAIAGVDSLSVDHTACEIMHINPVEIGYLVFAMEKGYGINSSDQIEIIGEKDISLFRKIFKKPKRWGSHILSWQDRGNIKIPLSREGINNNHPLMR